MILMLACFFILVCSTQTECQPRTTTVSSFVHQVTIAQDSTQTELTQWVTPMHIEMPLGNGNIQILSAAMFVHQDGAGILQDEAWGMLNTDISGQWALGKVAVLNLNASLPTGKRALAPTDVALTQNLTRNDLNFPIKTFGQGFDFGGALSFVRHRGHWTYSAGMGYQRKGAYEPISGLKDYKPGDEISGSLGFDYTYGPFVYRLSLAGTYFLTDRQDNTVVFQNGKQIMVQGAILYTGSRFRVKTQITEIARLTNHIINNGVFFWESRDSNGNDLRIDTQASWTPIKYLTLYALGHAKYLTANAHPAGSALYQGDAHLLEGGGGFALSIGLCHLNVRATKLSGKAQDNALELSAFNIRTALKVEF